MIHYSLVITDIQINLQLSINSALKVLREIVIDSTTQTVYDGHITVVIIYHYKEKS